MRSDESFSSSVRSSLLIGVSSERGHVILTVIPSGQRVFFFLATCKMFLLLLVFIISLIRLWLGIFFSMFFVLRVHWTSGICEFINVIKFGKSLAVIPWNTFFPSQASSFWVLNYTYVWHLEVVLQLTDDLLFIIIIIIFSQIHLELFSCYIFKLLVFFFWHV